MAASFCPPCPGLNSVHQAWLTNVLNRAAAGLMVESGMPMYSEELTSKLKEHFADLLESLNPAEAEEEGEEEEEEDDVA